jgi:hypothetical protein
MSTDERIRYCIAQAEEIEATLPPQDDPHMWDMPRLCAVMWRDMAERLAEAA